MGKMLQDALKRPIVDQTDQCPRCKGEGFYFRLPRGMNPFSASIEVTARAMQRIQCDCPAGQR